MASNLHHFTDVPACRLLADRTRRSDMDVKDYSESYSEMGRFLAMQLVNEFELEEYDIQHCEGIRKGVRIRDDNKIGILCLMRAGLYLSQGCRAIFRNSPMHLISPVRDVGLSQVEIEEIKSSELNSIIIVDSVVNTGKSIKPIFTQSKELGIKRIFVMAGVVPFPQANSLAKDYPEIRFYFGRLSHNSYVGSGTTDTGNRLFGTFNRK
jgi:uracil phosphoribosyltransferase